MTLLKEIKKDKLDIKIYNSRQEMGIAAAIEASNYIKSQLEIKPELNILFAAAPSQSEFLAALTSHDIDWSRINAYHIDEYIGLDADAPQLFGNFLRIHIFDRVVFQSVTYLSNTESAKSKYTDLLNDEIIDVAFIGIGENGHIAFNDPHVAQFDDKEMFKIVDLDIDCRIQQVNDGCFTTVEEVPTHALTLTIPALMKSERIFCIVPGTNKANAIKSAVEGEITEKCPASILRTHSNVTLYCDRDSAKYI